MNTLREYRVPMMIGVGTLVVALLLWTILISSQSSKVSSLKNQESQLQSQQVALQSKLANLKVENQQVPNSCADLRKIASQIPSVVSPTDIDAEESSFESQFNGLAATTGVVLTQFSGFAPATTTAGGTTATTAPATPANPSTAGNKPTPAPLVTPVPTTLAVSGSFSQITSFINGLDNFPRLFVIQKFVLTYGASTAPAGSTTVTTPASATPSASAPALWTGGTATAPAAGPYGLAITGSIYYTTTPNALDACAKATVAVSQH